MTTAPPSRLLALVAAALAVTGCLRSADEVDGAATLPASALLAELGALPDLGTTKDDAIVLPFAATPEGSISAVWWTVPEGSVRDVDGIPQVRFLAAPLVEKGRDAEVQRWLALAFAETADGLEIRRFAFGAPMEQSATGTLGGSDETHPTSLAPFGFGVADVSPGDRVGFVLAGVASAPVEMALVLAPFEVDGGEMPTTRDAFLAATEGAPRVALPTTSRAGEHMVSLLVQRFSTFGEQRISYGTAEASASTTGLGATGLRTVSVDNAFDATGFSFAFAAYGNDHSAGDWAATFDMHGESAQVSGTTRNVLGLPLSDVPFAAAAGEGDGPAVGHLDANVASAASSDVVIYFQLDVGATLTDLLGVAPAPLEPGDVSIVTASAPSLMWPPA